MTLAKPGEFAHNYAAWSPLLNCPAGALRSNYNLGSLCAIEDNLFAQAYTTSASPVRVDPQATRLSRGQWQLTSN